jgi:hypothetical protein
MTHESMMMFAETWIAAWNRATSMLCWRISPRRQFVSPVALLKLTRLNRPMVDRVMQYSLRQSLRLPFYWCAATDRSALRLAQARAGAGRAFQGAARVNFGEPLGIQLGKSQFTVRCPREAGHLPGVSAD